MGKQIVLMCTDTVPLNRMHKIVKYYSFLGTIERHNFLFRAPDAGHEDAIELASMSSFSEGEWLADWSEA